MTNTNWKISVALLGSWGLRHRQRYGRQIRKECKNRNNTTQHNKHKTHKQRKWKIPSHLSRFMSGRGTDKDSRERTKSTKNFNTNITTTTFTHAHIEWNLVSCKSRPKQLRLQELGECAWDEPQERASDGDNSRKYRLSAPKVTWRVFAQASTKCSFLYFALVPPFILL